MKNSVSMFNVLSRSEMKKTIAGSGGLRTVRCLANDMYLGEVQCTEDIENMTCCTVQYSETNQAVTVPQESPM